MISTVIKLPDMIWAVLIQSVAIWFENVLQSVDIQFWLFIESGGYTKKW